MTDNDSLAHRLRKAGSRWRTVRGTVRQWRRQDLVVLGFNRRSQVNAGAGIRSASVTAHTTEHSDQEPSDEVYEAVLAVAATNSGTRRRSETVSRIGQEWMVDVVVVDGTTFWARTGDTIQTNGGDPHSEHGGADFIRLLTPDKVPDGYDLTMADDREVVAGRQCDVVLAVAKAPDPYGETPGSEVFDMICGGDSFRLSVDQELGILMRVTKLVDGQQAEICEFLEIAVDETLDERLFDSLS